LAKILPREFLHPHAEKLSNGQNVAVRYPHIPRPARTAVTALRAGKSQTLSVPGGGRLAENFQAVSFRVTCHLPKSNANPLENKNARAMGGGHELHRAIIE
jgi:hypothetical protein